MPQGPAESAPAGFFLSLLTESFAVRAFLGSLLAVALAAVVLRSGTVRGLRARRLVILAPAIAALSAAVASLLEAEAYLPQLWVATSGGTTGRVLELFGELQVITSDRGVDVLVVGWLLVSGVLVARRLWGVAAAQRLLRKASPLPADHPLQQVASRLVRSMRVPAVRLYGLPGCPGGALTSGTRRPVIVVDPGLVAGLDEQEAEGLLAHEIAHVARRDTLLTFAVGVFADITFFLPTLHVVERALRREREESADELASQHTRRPGALASSILKVWEGAAPRPGALAACGAVAGTAALRLQWRRRRGLSSGARVVAARVERLVSPRPVGTGARQIAELLVAAALVLAAAAASIVVPQRIAADFDAYSVAFGYVPPPAEPVESPAFATFRALAPAPEEPGALHGYERMVAAPPAASHDRVATCPCVETQAQWFAGTAATVPDQPDTMAWRRTSAPPWDIGPAHDSVRARPLLTLVETGPRVGFFVVGQNRP